MKVCLNKLKFNMKLNNLSSSINNALKISTKNYLSGSGFSSKKINNIQAFKFSNGTTNNNDDSNSIKNVEANYSSNNESRVYRDEELIDNRYTSRSNLLSNLENYGYKGANSVHKYSTLFLFYFVIFNILLLIYRYNKYWRERRVSTIFKYLIINRKA